MNNSQKALQDALVTIDTLNKSLNKAGGCDLSIDNLQSMSALDLITLIAPNNIRFVYQSLNGEEIFDPNSPKNKVEKESPRYLYDYDNYDYDNNVYDYYNK